MPGCGFEDLSVFFIPAARWLKKDLFFGKGDLVEELLFIHRLDLHENTVGLIGAFILTYGKWLAAL